MVQRLRRLIACLMPRVQPQTGAGSDHTFTWHVALTWVVMGGKKYSDVMQRQGREAGLAKYADLKQLAFRCFDKYIEGQASTQADALTALPTRRCFMGVVYANGGCTHMGDTTGADGAYKRAQFRHGTQLKDRGFGRSQLQVNKHQAANAKTGADAIAKRPMI